MSFDVENSVYGNEAAPDERAGDVGVRHRAAERAEGDAQYRAERHRADYEEDPADNGVGQQDPVYLIHPD